jgi:hypothetical protein
MFFAFVGVPIWPTAVAGVRAAGFVAKQSLTTSIGMHNCQCHPSGASLFWRKFVPGPPLWQYYYICQKQSHEYSRQKMGRKQYS